MPLVIFGDCISCQADKVQIVTARHKRHGLAGVAPLYDSGNRWLTFTCYYYKNREAVYTDSGQFNVDWWADAIANPCTYEIFDIVGSRKVRLRTYEYTVTVDRFSGVITCTRGQSLILSFEGSSFLYYDPPDEPGPNEGDVGTWYLKKNAEGNPELGFYISVNPDYLTANLIIYAQYEREVRTIFAGLPTTFIQTKPTVNTDRHNNVDFVDTLNSDEEMLTLLYELTQGPWLDPAINHQTVTWDNPFYFDPNVAHDVVYETFYSSSGEAYIVDVTSTYYPEGDTPKNNLWIGYQLDLNGSAYVATLCNYDFGRFKFPIGTEIKENKTATDIDGNDITSRTLPIYNNAPYNYPNPVNDSEAISETVPSCFEGILDVTPPEYDGTKQAWHHIMK